MAKVYYHGQEMEYCRECKSYGFKGTAHTEHWMWCGVKGVNWLDNCPCGCDFDPNNKINSNPKHKLVRRTVWKIRPALNGK